MSTALVTSTMVGQNVLLLCPYARITVEHVFTSVRAYVRLFRGGVVTP